MIVRTLQRIAISRPIGALMFFASLMLLGGLALLQLEVNLLPDIKLPRITVITRYPNAAPQEMEALITRPLTEAISTVGGINKIISESSEGVSAITVEFRYGRNVDYGVMEVRERIDQVRNLLPQDAERSVVSRFDPSEKPFYEIAVFPRKLSNERDLKFFVRNELRPRLEKIDGVALVELSGGYDKEIHVDVDQDRMIAYDLSLSEIAESIRAANLNMPAGHITIGNKDILIRTLGEYRSPEEIADTTVGAGANNAPVFLRDVARVESSYRERRGLARYNGEECVIIALRKEAGKNTIRSAAAVSEEIASLRGAFADTLDIRVIYDESRFVSDAVSNITGSLAAGAVLAAISLFLILRNASSPLVIIAVIPVSLLCTFLLMYVRGISLNIMSLGGLSLGIGMLFDSGNVILSAIERQRTLGLNARDAALRGGSESSGSVTTAVLTTVVVFLPILFVDSIAGLVFKEMALTITFSLVSSLLVSLLLIPTLAAQRDRLNLDRGFQRLAVIAWAERIENRISRRYERALEVALERPTRLLVWTGMALVLVVLLAPFVQREFLPKVDSGELTVNLSLPYGSTLRQTAEASGFIEEVARQNGDVEHVITRLGDSVSRAGSRGRGAPETNAASIRIVLRQGGGLSSEELAEQIREQVRFRPEVRMAMRLSGDALSEVLNPDEAPVTVDIAGEDLATLEAIGNELRSALQKVDSLDDVQTTMDERPLEYHVTFDMERLALSGLTVSSLSTDLRTAVDGRAVSAFRMADDEIDIRVQIDQSRPFDVDSLGSLTMRAPDGPRVFLSQMADIRTQQGYTTVLLDGSSRINRLTANVDEGADRNEAFADVHKAIVSIPLPEGYTIRESGEQERVRESIGDLGVAFGLATLLIFMLLAGKFESIRHAGVMLATIPLIAIGIIPALFLSGKSLNVSSFTGIILLVGIVVDNAALFHEYVELLLHEGYEFRAAIVESGKIVLRPILLNNGTTLLGLLPVALEIGDGTEFQSPMGIAVISGLAASVFLSLFLTPALFYLLDRKKYSRFDV